MGTKNNRVDAYIDQAAPFAKPILKHLRALVHEVCPEVTETMKWRFPHFEYKGMMCNMAAFKQHCTFGFWKAAIMQDPILMANAKSETAMGHLGRIEKLKDLPSDKKLKAYIKEAVLLNYAGAKVLKVKPIKDEIPMPDDFVRALMKNKVAKSTFDNFSPSHKREYLEWLTEAKTEATRQRRMATAMEWLAEGKHRHWKYK